MVSNDYITQLSSSPRGSCRRWRRGVVGKATSRRRSHLGPDELGSREDADKIHKESQHPAEWTPRPPVEHQKNENIKVSVGFQLPLTRKPWTSFSNPCNKERGNICIKKSSCVFIIASVYLLCRYDAVDEYITWCFSLINWIISNRTVFDIKTVFTLNWIVTYITA